MISDSELAMLPALPPSRPDSPPVREQAASEQRAHNQSNITCRIPQEMLASCFTFLDLFDLMRASHVCVAWRSTALAFSMLWRNIRLEQEKPHLDKLLATFLARSRHHPVHLDIWTVFQSAVLIPILNEHLDHLRSLSWRSKAPVELIRPAPLLKSIMCDRLSPGPIPADLLGRSAPRLRILVLGRLWLPVECPALANITYLSAKGAFENDEQAETFCGIFLLMPRLIVLKLKELSLEVCSFLPAGPIMGAPRKLRDVELSCCHDFDIVATVAAWRTPQRDFREIVLSLPLALWRTVNMGLLFTDALVLSIDLSETCIKLVVTTTAGRKRDFSLYTFDLDFYPDPSKFGDLPELMHKHRSYLYRVSTLRVPASVLNAELVRAMPALTNLTVVVHKWSDDPHRKPEVQSSYKDLSCLGYIPSIPALASLTVQLDVRCNEFGRQVDVTPDDAKAVVSAIANFLRPRDRTQETVELAVTGFPSLLVKDVNLPDIVGYSTSVKIRDAPERSGTGESR